ncbi:MAG: SUMF1/EgtB/PvdO family nonheme iron enzyme [Acidobacteriaceae bacterium]|nr:SUMF1/EgtB/PvdO family nonheme iron enzyme [Acidobacteriaceae bacterium]
MVSTVAPDVIRNEDHVSALRHSIHLVRCESDRFFEIIKPEAIYDRPIDARHRVIFYIGHLDGFDAIQICREHLGVRSTDPALDELFQAGIDPDARHLPSDKASDWPSLADVLAYVKRCRARVDAHLTDASPDVLAMALEHRLMHLETLGYMFHNFEYAKKNEPATCARGRLTSGDSPNNGWVEIPAGTATLGKKHDGTFGWDNEYGELRVEVDGFRIQQYSVTNGDYLSFVREGAKMPHFWTERNGRIYYRGMFAEIQLPLDWPVYVTHDEAQAYAAWAKASIATEAQFHRAAYGTPEGLERSYPWGEQPPSEEHGNFDFRTWDPWPVSAHSQGDSAFGVRQLVGNGWQWTSTPFAAFPGFSPSKTYPGYSANFFDGEHYVLKGGSARTAAALLRRSFRNWFRRDYPYMYATFRCVMPIN